MRQQTEMMELMTQSQQTISFLEERVGQLGQVLPSITVACQLRTPKQYIATAAGIAITAYEQGQDL